MMSDLNIAEVPFETGIVQYRYSRYLSDDGSRWVRHGLFRAYHPDGSIASEGTYSHGKEHGTWKDFHPNGQLAATGEYRDGKEVGEWRFWDEDGTPSVR